MPTPFKQLIADLRPEPPAGLVERAMTGIRLAQARSMRRRFVLLFGATCASAAAFFVSLVAARSALARAGSLEFMSLVFSDAKTVFLYWKDFAYTLLESLPVGTIAAFLAVGLCFAASVRALARNMRGVWSARVFHV